VCALCIDASSARASDVSEGDRTRATQLFRDARALMAEKRYAEACGMLEESQRLDPAGGTLLNVALCHELQGRAATAWSEFKEAMRVAQRDHRPDREAAAEGHVRALEPHLARLVIEVPPDARVRGVVVRRDGAEVAAADWGAAVPVDPGDHVVEAEAPGRTPWRATISVGGEGDSPTVRIPVLEPPPPVPSPPPVLPPEAAPPAPPAPVYREAEVQAKPPLAPRPVRSIQRPIAIGVGVAGVVGLGIGASFGLQASSKWGDAQPFCRDGMCTTATAYASWQDARSSASTATAAFVVGAVAMATGIVLWVTAPASSVRVDLTPAAASARAEF
jgi:hypothetical protein